MRFNTKARKIFDIHPGDNLILLGDESQGIAVIKEDRFLDMLKRREITGEIENA